MSRRSRMSLVALVLLPLPAVAVPPAVAATADRVSRVVLHDPTGDVWSVGEDEPVLAGDEPTVDFVRAVASHRRHHVVVKMTFSDLRRVEERIYVATIFSRQHAGMVMLTAGPGRWQGHHQLVDEYFERVRCPQLSHDIDYDADRVTMTVPRSCLGQPAFVRVGMSGFILREGEGDEVREITDQPHSDGPDGPFTRRLYRAEG